MLEHSYSQGSSFDPNDDQEPLPYVASSDKKGALRPMPNSALNHDISNSAEMIKVPGLDGTTGTTSNRDLKGLMSRGSGKRPSRVNFNEEGQTFVKSIHQGVSLEGASFKSGGDVQSSSLVMNSSQPDLESSKLKQPLKPTGLDLSPYKQIPVKPTINKRRDPSFGKPARQDSKQNVAQPLYFPEQQYALCPNCSQVPIRSKTTRRPTKKIQPPHLSKEMTLSSRRQRKASKPRNKILSMIQKQATSSLQTLNASSRQSQESQRFKRGTDRNLPSRLPNIFQNQYSSAIQQSSAEVSEPKIITHETTLEQGSLESSFDRHRSSINLEPLKPQTVKNTRFLSQGRNQNKLKTAAGVPRDLDPKSKALATVAQKLKELEKKVESASLTTPTRGGGLGESQSMPQIPADKRQEPALIKPKLKSKELNQLYVGRGHPSRNSKKLKPLPLVSHYQTLQTKPGELLRNRKIPVANMTFGDNTFDSTRSTKHTRRKKSSKARGDQAAATLNPLEAYTGCNPITPSASGTQGTADADETKTWNNTRSIAEILNSTEGQGPPQTIQALPTAKFTEAQYSVEEEEFRFSRIITKTVNHFQLLPIVMQGDQLLGKLKGTSMKDFMDRQILFVKPRFKLRRPTDWSVQTFYAEISVFNSKFYIVLVHQEAESSPSRKGWIESTSMHKGRANINYSTSTTVLEVWRKQAQTIFMNDYRRLREVLPRLKAIQQSWASLLSRVQFRLDTLVFQN